MSEYRPGEIEKKWYHIWEREGYFSPDNLIEPGLQNPPLHLDAASEDITTDPSQIHSSLFFNEETLRNDDYQYFSSSSGEETVRIKHSQTRPPPLDTSHIPSSDNSQAQSPAPPAGEIDDQTPLTSPTAGNEHRKHCSRTFSVITPPPNITGTLHCGHALAVALEDCLVRWHRMRGFKTLFIPGIDHAGVATEFMLEKRMIREIGKNRQQAGSIRFLNRADKWKNLCEAKIYEGFRKMGGSFDWNRKAYSLDEDRSNVVTEAFFRLHEAGYIYRAYKIVNWCPTLRTALSNMEVCTMEVTEPAYLDVPGYTEKIEFGYIYYFKYVVVLDDNSVVWINLATVRPETLLGDTGIAYHPDDSRYNWMIGLRARHPYSGRLLPIVGDSEVDPNFGTGAITIVPGHDELSSRIGRRNNMDPVLIFDEDGIVNENGGEFRGLKRFQARLRIIENLVDRCLLIRKEACREILTICSRSNDIIEPLLKPQWWLRLDEMAAAALSSLKEDKMNIQPEQAKEDLIKWLEDPKDWCITQQILWGHQVPAWLVTLKEEIRRGVKPRDTDPRRWVIAKSEQEALEIAIVRFAGKPLELTRDGSVLDTWFSSALWPLSAFGWPSERLDFKDFYPASFLDTGSDILYMWVARMLMVCQQLTANLPFKEVYCHPLVRDSDGRKMSKSLGNVIDPIDIIDGISLEDLDKKLLETCRTPNAAECARTWKFQNECFPDRIPECGADALRFALIEFTASNSEFALDINKVVEYRRFCDKIFAAVKQFLSTIPQNFTPKSTGHGDKVAGQPRDKAFLRRLNNACLAVHKALESRKFSLATSTVYGLWRDHICSEYLDPLYEHDAESGTLGDHSKIQTSFLIIEAGLRLLHPFMPFITEELWQMLPRRAGDESPSIMLAPYPIFDPEYDRETELNTPSFDVKMESEMAKR